MASDDDKSRSRSRSADSRRKSRKTSDDDKSRSRSRSRSPARENQERVTKVIDIATDDAAFVLGGADEAQDRARVGPTSSSTNTPHDHAQRPEKQHHAPIILTSSSSSAWAVTIDMERSRGACGIHGPRRLHRFVMGRNGQTLRSMEEEWGVLMFFAKTEGSQRG